MQRINSLEWGIDQYDLYARHQTEKVEREISQLNHEIQTCASKIFQNPAIGDALVRQNRNELEDALDRLEFNPRRFGMLRGGLFSPSERKEALEQARYMRVLLRSRDDRQAVLERYERMHSKCARLRDLRERERPEWREFLENEREDCDATNEVRAREQRAREAQYQTERSERCGEPQARSERSSPDWYPPVTAEVQQQDTQEDGGWDKARPQSHTGRSSPDWYRPATAQDQQRDAQVDHRRDEAQPHARAERSNPDWHRAKSPATSQREDRSPRYVAVQGEAKKTERARVSDDEEWWRLEATARSVPYVGTPEIDDRTGKVTQEWEDKRREIEERIRSR